MLGFIAAVAGLFQGRAALAQLGGDFAGALDIEQSYVTGATSATDIAFAADGRALVTTKLGDIVIRKLDGSQVVISGTFPNLDTDSEKGLTGVVAHPSEPNVFFFYADNGPSITDKHRVYRGVLDSADALSVDLDHPIVGAGVNAQDEGLEGPANHDGGGLWIFDGHLYVSVGDTGANASPPTNKYASCLNKGNGKILRVNLDGSIPSDNPLVGLSSVTSCDSVNADWSTAAPDQRIYAWGLRNPFRFWVDRHTGRMWIGDVGEVSREEISVSDPASAYTGQDFGYPFREGLLDWNTNGGSLSDHDCSTLTPGRACTDPVTDYDHSIGNCVIGGLIPEGCGWTSAFGGKLYYWFADNGAGWIKALEVNGDRSGVVSPTPVDVASFSGGPSAIRQGPNGAIYLVNNFEGTVYEFKPKVQTGSDCLSSGNGGNGGTSGTGAVSGGNAGAGEGGESGAGAAGTNNGGTTSGSGGTATGGTSTSAGGHGGTRSGTGGTPQSGGMSGEAGAGAAAGTSGESAGGTAGAAGSKAGAGRAAGGNAGRAGAGSGGTATKSKSGCGCRVGGESRDDSAFGVMAMLGAAGVARRRRAKRARQPG